MAKYTSNEQYENDKILLLSILLNSCLDYSKIVALVDFIEQSKWNGAVDEAAFKDGYQAGYIDGANDFAEGEDND